MYLWGVARVCHAPVWLRQEDGAKSTHLNKSVLGVALGEHSEAPGGAVAWLCAPVFRDQPWHHRCTETRWSPGSRTAGASVPFAYCTIQCAQQSRS